MKALLLFLCLPFLLAARLSVTPNADVALLVNAETGAVLYEKKPDELCYPASITKIATALYAAKLQRDWNEVIEVPSEAIGSISSSAKKKANYKKPAYWIEVGSTHVGLKKGERLKFCDLMGAMMLASANDAANVIAYHLGNGDIDRFVEGMNKYMKEIGCKNTQFCNPHGLYMPKHQTTARDMALMARAFMKDEKLSSITSKGTYTIEATNKQEKRTLVSTNRLLRKGSYHYPKAIGLKTGYTNDSKCTLVAAAKDKGRVLIAVLMKCEEKADIYKDAMSLFDKAFEEEKVTRTLLTKGKKLVKKKLEGAASLLEGTVKETVALSYYPSEEPQLVEHFAWEKDLKPGIPEGVPVAKVTWKNQEGQQILEASIVAASAVEPSFWYSLSENVTLPEIVLALGTIVLLGTAILLWKRRRKSTP